jgi:hypothetical protein
MPVISLQLGKYKHRTMEQDLSWQASSRAAGQEILCFIKYNKERKRQRQRSPCNLPWTHKGAIRDITVFFLQPQRYMEVGG